MPTRSAKRGAAGWGLLRRAAAVAAVPALLAVLTAAYPAAAQNGPPPPAVETPESPSAPALSRSQVEQQLARIKEAPGPQDEAQQKLVATYEAALQELSQADQFRAQADDFDARRAEAPELLKQMRQKLAAPPEEVRVQVPAGAGAGEVAQRTDAADAALEAAKAQAAELEAEPQRRADRRIEVPRRLAAAEQELAEVRQRLVEEPAGELSDQAQADRVLLAAREERLEQEIRALNSEIASYDARRDLLTVRADAAARDVRRLEEEDRQWHAALARLRQQEATDMQQRTAKEAAEAHPAAAAIAEENQVLAGRLTGPDGLAKKLQQEDARLRTVVDELGKWTSDFTRVQARVNSAGITKAIGALLRQKKLELPNPQDYKRGIRQRQDAIADAQLTLIEWEEQRTGLGDMDAAVDRRMSALPGTFPASERPQVEADVRTLLQTRRELLDLLIREQNQLFSSLIELNARREQLVALIEQYERYIEEKVLWFGSSAPLSPRDLGSAWRSIVALLSPSGWLSAGRSLAADASGSPVLYVVVLVLVVWLASGGRLKKRLAEVGGLVRSAETDSFRLTLGAVALTAGVALPGPLLVWLLGWRMSAPLNAPEFAKMLGAAFRSTVPLYLTLNVMRQACRKGGLADAHFRWPDQSTSLVRRHLRWLTPAVLPPAFAHYAAVWDEGTDQALAALSLVAVLACLSVFMWRVLHPVRGVPAPVVARHPGGWTDRLRYVWHTGLAGLPLALAAGTVAGYQYTARELAEKLLETIWLGLALLLLYSLLLRWLFVARRRLALERARKRREAAEGEPAAEGEAPAPAEPEVSLRAIGEQTRSLIANLSAVLLIVGLWFVWRDVLPALGFFSSWTVWDNVTLGNLGRALIVVVVAYVAARNIPGLLEITILQRLPLEGGVRFAISTISRYVISLVGIILAFQAIGIGWDKVQWLAAAVTVGLGFGLQEIFANFVSGLIVLLERPMRVGDTVTVGETTGTVTRIRMRATTITDWDRKELVVPNKEFVTGRLVNWTLSDRILRLVVPVGIAYGSDTELARKTILKVASAHPDVLSEPPPAALFMGFGESSLDFELRVFLPNVEVLLQTRSDLHFAIDQAFREAGIEIAFPQRDVHVRSIQAPLHLEQGREDRSTSPGD